MTVERSVAAPDGFRARAHWHGRLTPQACCFVRDKRADSASVDKAAAALGERATAARARQPPRGEKSPAAAAPTATSPRLASPQKATPRKTSSVETPALATQDASTETPASAHAPKPAQAWTLFGEAAPAATRRPSRPSSVDKGAKRAPEAEKRAPSAEKRPASAEKRAASAEKRAAPTAGRARRPSQGDAAPAAAPAAISPLLEVPKPAPAVAAAAPRTSPRTLPAKAAPQEVASAAALAGPPGRTRRGLRGDKVPAAVAAVEARVAASSPKKEAPKPKHATGAACSCCAPRIVVVPPREDPRPARAPSPLPAGSLVPLGSELEDRLRRAGLVCGGLPGDAPPLNEGRAPVQRSSSEPRRTGPPRQATVRRLY